MGNFKANAALTSALLRAADTLAHLRPACDASGKALDRAAFLSWRDACVRLAVRETREAGQ
jgi:hypothetical protein